jgi:hypothetical protein
MSSSNRGFWERLLDKDKYDSMGSFWERLLDKDKDDMALE